MAAPSKREAGQRGFVVGRDKVSEAPASTASRIPGVASIRTHDGLGLEFKKGTGLSMQVQEKLRTQIKPLSGQVPLRADGTLNLQALGAADAGITMAPNVNAYACSAATFDFLRVNVLRREDITPVLRTGMVLFNRAVGVHVIPLSEGTEGGPGEIGGAFEGAFFVPDTQSLIVTDFRVFAARSNPGLPGAHLEVDPLALIGQVCFYLLAESGEHALPEITLANGEPCSGTEILGDVAAIGFPALTDTVESSIQAIYNVSHSPFPGFPKIVGARMRGYLVNTALLSQALDNAVRTGG